MKSDKPTHLPPYENMSKETIKTLAKATYTPSERRRMTAVLRAKGGKMSKCVFEFKKGTRK